MSDMLRMLELAAHAHAPKLTIDMGEKAVSAGEEWIGYWLDDKRYWIGLYFDKPEFLTIGTYACRVDPEMALAVNRRGNLIGDAKTYRADDDSYGWYLEYDLASAKRDFFAQPLDGQVVFIEEALREFMRTIREIEQP